MEHEGSTPDPPPAAAANRSAARADDPVGWHLSYLRQDIAAATADLEELIEAAHRRDELLDDLADTSAARQGDTAQPRGGRPRDRNSDD